MYHVSLFALPLVPKNNPMKTIMILISLAFAMHAGAQVAISTDNSAPDNSAMLDIKSSDKGILIPRMSAAERNTISNPAKGLLVFCTDENSFFVNRGTSSSPDWTSLESWTTNGTDVYYIGGNVGIGVTYPTAKLDVRGSTPDDGIIFQIGNSDVSHRLMLFGGRQNDPNPFVQWKQGDPLRFVTDEGGWSEKMRITSNGRVGIGTSSPASLLDISGGNNWDLISGEGDLRIGNGQYRLKAGVALGGGGAGAAGIMQYGQTGGYNVLKLGAQGNYLLFLNGETQGIGIGTDSPGAALEISSTTQGFLPPRMGQAQINILDPVLGLLVFNTTTLKPNYYDGTQWRNFDGTIAFGIGVSCLGGKIAYILQNGDPGYDPNVIHGLIAAPIDQSIGTEWGCSGTGISGADGTAIGTGSQNTIDIVAGCTTDGIAAKLCSDLTLDGYSDWYLPSKDELSKLFLNMSAIGGFADLYWSSSEYDNEFVHTQSFNNGIPYLYNKGHLNGRVRAIRSF